MRQSFSIFVFKLSCGLRISFMSTRQDTFYVGSTAPLLLLSVSNVVVVHILSLSRGFKLSLLSGAIIGFNIQIYLYNQMRGTGGPKEPFSRIPCYNRYVYKNQGVDELAQSDKLRSVGLHIAKIKFWHVRFQRS